MSPDPIRSSDRFAWWLAAGTGLAIMAALFSATREKPAVLFAAGFGLLMGLALRLLAQSLDVQNESRVPWCAGLIVACGFVLCFVPSYRRAAQEWNRVLSEQPSDPLAAALMKRAEQAAATPAVRPYSLHQYLQRRLPAFPSPWPAVLFCAEWIGCGLIAGGCVALKPRPQRSL